jgi:DNA-binding NtrC family response regulator
VPPANETVDQPWTRSSIATAGAPIPGLVLVFANGRATVCPIPLSNGRVDLGRGLIGEVQVDDPCMSRKHAEVSFESGAWRLRDLQSRNGSAVDGAPLVGEVLRPDPRVLRVGDTLLVFTKDLRPFQAHPAKTASGRVCGPTLAAAWREIERAAESGDTVHLVGETGSGKELAALLFHEAKRSSAGRFVAVNCAAIPEGLAERLLFGAKRGAYSGADSDATGYVQEANGGTLFLDEIGDLDLLVQAKLLRVLESREVLALGESRPVRVDLRICSATHKSLRVEVAAGRFREDLFFRIGVPSIALPALRDRLEDIPALLELELARIDASLVLHVSFVEASLLRHWPGNVREILVAVKSASQKALTEGRGAIESRDLDGSAGRAFDQAPAEAEGPLVEVLGEAGGDITKAELEAALLRAGGNVSRAARALKLHRTQLRRELARYGIEPQRFRE